MPDDRSRRLRSRDWKLWAAGGGPPVRIKGDALASKTAPESFVDT